MDQRYIARSLLEGEPSDLVFLLSSEDSNQCHQYGKHSLNQYHQYGRNSLKGRVVHSLVKMYSKFRQPPRSRGQGHMRTLQTEHHRQCSIAHSRFHSGSQGDQEECRVDQVSVRLELGRWNLVSR